MVADRRKSAVIRYYYLGMKRTLFIIALLLLAAAIFEFLPAVKYWRVVVPQDIYVGKTCDCNCILESRPWYSRLNYWFWFWIVSMPIITFSVKPTAPKWQRAVRTVASITLCYGVMNLALHLSWDIRNGPFVVNSDIPWQKTWDIPNCANTADGASMVFTALFGWIFATVYAGWWEMIWLQYHKHKTRLITKDYKRDWISRITVWASVIITTLLIPTVAILIFLS